MSKGKVSTALNFLSKELKRVNLCSNTKPIEEAITEMNKRKDSNGQWGYNLQKLTFNNIRPPRGTIPNNIKFLQIVLTVEIHEKGLNDNEIFNPVIIDKKKGIEKNYNFSIELSGHSDGKRVHSHWHLDFDSSSDNEYIHPEFHLTFGGNKLKKKTEDDEIIEEDINQALGKLLLIPSPRLPHPPMDAVLGIDFVIKNFVTKDVARAITSNPQYRNAVKTSQNRLWRPYMLSTAHHWCNFNGCKFQTDNELSKKYHPSLEK